MNRRDYSMYQTRLTGPESGSSLLGRILRLIVILALLVVGFMFSLVVFAVLAVGGVLVWAYFWWKTRKLRQVLREQGGIAADTARAGQPDIYAEGNVIEGEVIREETSRDFKPGDSSPR